MKMTLTGSFLGAESSSSNGFFFGFLISSLSSSSSSSGVPGVGGVGGVSRLGEGVAASAASSHESAVTSPSMLVTAGSSGVPVDGSGGGSEGTKVFL